LVDLKTEASRKKRNLVFVLLELRYQNNFESIICSFIPLTFFICKFYFVRNADPEAKQTNPVGVNPSSSTTEREFYLGTVAPPGPKQRDKPLTDNNISHSENTTEELLQMILNNIKLKSDSRLRPKLGSE
jgi:hypothetical protein